MNGFWWIFAQLFVFGAQKIGMSLLEVKFSCYFLFCFCFQPIWCTLYRV